MVVPIFNLSKITNYFFYIVVKRVRVRVKPKLHFEGLVKTTGTKLKFLGMDIEFCKNGKVKIGTKDYVSNAIEQFDDNVSRNIPYNAGL